MSARFLDIAFTPNVRAAQLANGGRDRGARPAGEQTPDRFTASEAEFIAERDSFYMASVSETGWPYAQHRGGPAGFLKPLDDRTLAFADFRGNRQYVSLGNLSANPRVALFLMDYPNRRRLKIYGHAEAVDLALDPDLADLILTPGYPGRPERAMKVRLEAFDWNCPQHITPRYSATEIEGAFAAARARITELEAELRDLWAARTESDV